MSKRKKMLMIAVLSASLLGINVSSSHAKEGMSFVDVKWPDNAWASDTIQWAINHKVVDGYADGTFRPNQSVEQSEFLAMLIRTYQPNDFTMQSDPEHWEEPYLAYAAHKRWNLVTPSVLNRGMVAQLLGNALGKNYSLEDSIQFLLDSGLSQGKTDKTIEGFKKDDAVTRVEALTFIQRVRDHFAQLQERPLIEEAYVKQTKLLDLPPWPMPGDTDTLEDLNQYKATAHEKLKFLSAKLNDRNEHIKSTITFSKYMSEGEVNSLVIDYGIQLQYIRGRTYEDQGLKGTFQTAPQFESLLDQKFIQDLEMRNHAKFQGLIELDAYLTVDQALKLSQHSSVFVVDPSSDPHLVDNPKNKFGKGIFWDYEKLVLKK